MLYYAVLECGSIVSIYSEDIPVPGDTYVGVQTNSAGHEVSITGKISYLYE